MMQATKFPRSHKPEFGFFTSRHFFRAEAIFDGLRITKPTTGHNSQPRSADQSEMAGGMMGYSPLGAREWIYPGGYLTRGYCSGIHLVL